MAEWLAETYADHSTLQESMAGKVLGALDLDEAARVLDVGCGDGKITAAIARRAPRGSVVGVDPHWRKRRACCQRAVSDRAKKLS